MKSEGTLLAFLALAAWGAAALLSLGLAGFVRATRPRAGALAVVAVVLALRLAYARWTVAADIDFVYAPVRPSMIVPALRRIPQLAPLVALEMARVWKWGLLWPAFFAGGVVLLARREPVRRVLAAAALTALAAYVSTFLLTRAPLEWHVATALDRILAQLAPVAVVVAVVGLTPPGDDRAA